MSGPAGGPFAGSEKARRYAAAILAVLSGEKTTAEGSVMMGVTLPRYYQLETRAIEGMVSALEPKPKGRQRTLESELLASREEARRLSRELSRAQSLLRAAHRTLGAKEPAKGKAAKRTRKPDRTKRTIARLVRPGEDGGKEKVGSVGAGDKEGVSP